MSSQEKRREVIALIKAKVLKQSEAATILGITTRQVKRLCRAERNHGAIELTSTRRGQPATNRTSDVIKQQIIVLAQNKYVGFGPTFMAEKLRELDSIELSKESVRKILMSADLWKGKITKKKSVHQQRMILPQRSGLAIMSTDSLIQTQAVLGNQ
jgi:transposase